MKILYGVVGEGMGHAIRSKVVLEHLMGEGHEVEIVASQRAVDFLRKHFPEVHRIHGLHMVTEENRIRKGKTLFNNVLRGTAAVPSQIKAYFRMIDDFAPEAVVSDFESWTYFYGKTHRLPVTREASLLATQFRQMCPRFLHRIEEFRAFPLAHAIHHTDDTLDHITG